MFNIRDPYNLRDEEILCLLDAIVDGNDSETELLDNGNDYHDEIVEHVLLNSGKSKLIKCLYID